MYDGPGGRPFASFLLEHAPCAPGVPCPSCDAPIRADARPARCAECGLALSWRA